jgi:hypothetical protein
MLNRLSVRVAANRFIEVPIWFPQSIINIIENRDLFCDLGKWGHFHTYPTKPYKVALYVGGNLFDMADIRMLGCAYICLTVASQHFILTVYTNKKED